MITIGIDGQALTIKPSGISNFLIIFLNSILKRWSNINVIVFTPQDLEESIKDQIHYNKNLKLVINEKSLFRNNHFLWRNLCLPYQLTQYKIDLFWAPAGLLPVYIKKNGFKTLLTVHDLAYKEFFKTLSWKNKVQTVLQGDRSIKKADLIWTVSKYTRRLVMDYYGVDEKDIFVGSTVDQSNYKPLKSTNEDLKNVKERFNLGDKFLLFVGNIEPRKNLIFMLRLMPELVAKGYKLCIVGMKGWGDSGLDEILNDSKFPKESIIFPGYLTNYDLLLLYNSADMYVSTSLNEGFGMPQLEAMSCGCPVVTAHNSAMIEVVEGAGITIKGWNTQDWIDAIEKIENDKDRYVNQSLKRAKEYDIDNIMNRLGGFLFR